MYSSNLNLSCCLPVIMPVYVLLTRSLSLVHGPEGGEQHEAFILRLDEMALITERSC